VYKLASYKDLLVYPFEYKAQRGRNEMTIKSEGKEDSEEKKNYSQVSKYFTSAGTLFEQIFDPKTNTSRFAAWDKIGKTIVYEESLEEYNTIYNPIKDELLTKNVIFLPSDPIDYGSIEELEKEIEIHIKKYLDISDEHRQKTVWYIQLTWIIDNLNTIPYLRALGDYGTGKTRYLDVIGGLCYKPMYIGGSVRTAPIYRVIDRWHGTAIFDEFTLTRSDESQDIIQILNNGYQRGKPVLRCASENYDEVRAFDPFGPKIMASRKEFTDRALESRCVTEIMKETNNKDISSTLSKNFYEEQRELRNKLLMYRLKNIYITKTDENKNIDFGTIQPRIKQSYMPFTVLFLHDDTRLKNFISEVKKHDLELVNQNRTSMDGGLVNQFLEKRYITKIKNITSKELMDGLPDEGWNENKLPSVQTVGKHLKALGFKSIPTNIDGKTCRILTIDNSDLKHLIDRYVLPEDKEKYLKELECKEQEKINKSGDDQIQSPLSDKLKKMKKTIVDSKNSGYKIDLDFLNRNFDETLIKKAIDDKLIIKDSNNEYSWN